ncbi:MAG: hypothetical protein ACRD4U_04770 [Candidatus Acidiferrales bacterium]
MKVLDVSGAALSQIVEEKVTCPFLGPAVAACQLPVRNDAGNPLASIEDVRRLGNTGGGDLGDLLVLFAKGNHAFMRGPMNQLDENVPNELFSLELPGSQGSHPGHSGILEGDPEKLGSGRFSQQDFARLASHSRDGLLKRSEVGRFIAENLHRDPNSKVLEATVAKLLLEDLAKTVLSAGALLPSLFGSDAERDRAHREFEQKLTKMMGENNLVGSAGEFGLLFAFLANSPGATEVDGEPTVSFEDVRSMFAEKRLPDGWEGWKKTRWDWLRNTTGLLKSALAEYHELKAKRR